MRADYGFVRGDTVTLAELERGINEIRRRPLILLCKTPDGRERKMSLEECATTGSTYIHLCAGNDLDDLDKLLEDELPKIGRGTAAERK